MYICNILSFQGVNLSQINTESGTNVGGTEKFLPDWVAEDGEMMVRRIIQRYLDARARNMTVDEVARIVFNVRPVLY